MTEGQLVHFLEYTCNSPMVTKFEIAVLPDGKIEFQVYLLERPTETKRFTISNGCAHCAVIQAMECLAVGQVVAWRNYYDDQVRKGQQVRLVLAKRVGSPCLPRGYNYASEPVAPSSSFLH